MGLGTIILVSSHIQMYLCATGRPDLLAGYNGSELAANWLQIAPLQQAIGRSSSVWRSNQLPSPGLSGNSAWAT